MTKPTREFVAGVGYALALLATQHRSEVEIRDALGQCDFLDGDLSRPALVAAGFEEYDAEQIAACLECRDPADV